MYAIHWIVSVSKMCYTMQILQRQIQQSHGIYYWLRLMNNNGIF